MTPPVSSNAFDVVGGEPQQASAKTSWLCWPRVGDGQRTSPGVALIFQGRPGYCFAAPPVGGPPLTKVPLSCVVCGPPAGPALAIPAQRALPQPEERSASSKSVPAARPLADDGVQSVLIAPYGWRRRGEAGESSAKCRCADLFAATKGGPFLHRWWRQSLSTGLPRRNGRCCRARTKRERFPRCVPVSWPVIW